jgi:hypothetical protein
MAKTTLEVLKDWTLANIRHKDLLRREVVEIEQEKDGWNFVVHSKTGDKVYGVALTADFGEVAKRAEGKSVVIVVPNTKENLNALTTSWNQLVKLGSFCVYFVNPYSLLEKYWTVCPAVHEKIADKTTLKKGLEAMFVTVEPYVESPKEIRLS